ncbi:MAG: GNAT family N-acetyltransferase [Saprospiraceae bacterium]
MSSYFYQNSNRLLYRKLGEKDIPSWVAFFEKNANLNFLGLDLSIKKEILARDWILKQLNRYEAQGLGHLAVEEKATGDFIGMGGILPRLLAGENVFEIAYSLKPAYWGKGYGTEIAIQMKQFGFRTQLSNRFVSIIHQDNLASMRVAEKNGMQVAFETNYLGMEVYVYETKPLSENIPKA